MDAFEKRKSRQEQRKYAKELSSNKQAEKAKRKKETLEDIEDWKRGTKRARCVPVLVECLRVRFENVRVEC